MSSAAYPSVRPRPSVVTPPQLILDAVGRGADGGGVPVVSVARAADPQPDEALHGAWPRCMGRDAGQHLTVGARPLSEIATVIGTPFRGTRR